MSALSLQQPNAEQVLRGKKKIEYRNMPTKKRERVYILCELEAAHSRVMARDRFESERSADRSIGRHS